MSAPSIKSLQQCIIECAQAGVITAKHAKDLLAELDGESVPSEPTPPPCAQYDPGAHIFMREAIVKLREQRDAHGNRADPYDALTIVARNLRDAFEWLWPLLWRDDPEFIPFAQRRREP